MSNTAQLQLDWLCLWLKIRILLGRYRAVTGPLQGRYWAVTALLLGRYWGVTRPLQGCYSAVTAVFGPPADVSLDLTGPEGPLRRTLSWTGIWPALRVQLHDVTDDLLASLLPLVPDRRTALTITGKQRQHPELTMYCCPVNGADT